MKPSKVFRKAAELLEHPMTFVPFACHAIMDITGKRQSTEQELFYFLYYHDSDAPREKNISSSNVAWWRTYSAGPRILALLFAAEFYGDLGQ